MTNTKTVLSVVASFAASAMLIPSIRSQIHSYVCSNLHGLSHHFSSQITFVIEEFYFQELFMAVDTYLGTKLIASVGHLKASKQEGEKKLAITMDKDEETCDVFDDIEVKWKLIFKELRCYQLTFNQKHKEKVLNSYLPYILQQAEAIKEENEIRKINMLQGLTWTSSTEFHHPMTFSTIAMDAELKQAVLDDLNTFMNSKEYYKRIGKAWKRTYLIHGPPGTGKSSLIAAIANHLNYNIYQVDLSYFQKGDDIRDLLLHYITRSVLVIKDIDSPIKPGYQETEAEPRIEAQKQAQLLKVLRLIDGLWLPRGNELIIIFTTNHRERIAPELLIPGRIDMQIPMSYCTISTFNELVYMYYSVIFCKPPKEIEQLLEKVKVTPAEVVEELTRSSDNTDFLVRLTKFLQEKQLENLAAENCMKI
ncbi:AAA-ATPase At3g50940 [Hevea brasiliensis]|uniref:AAA-ATPase At3g50940 n=1 Tax=Hevea brasiliensis TaxID=3981 RepID=UPI0025F27DA2|nr:AAA-ATPase At3g50940 [Hevea brasiliensis]